ncbi:hypothetical protein [Fuchsiella alkaliacetigena]|uniref:hypothetical protein n=1 Tax=Fuchsiella alkaliacetigena TaxID=957042 RepID=UPI00200B9CC9|nr:hypothetical protein [Fuchsiella alkaliacetigena]MCK8826075.1 hypothetical protein [Fuchsiella alkaliacetigena]
MEFLEISEGILHGLKFLFWALATHLFHYRQNFYHWSLLLPLYTLYPLAAILLLAELYPVDWILTLLTINLVITIAAHLWGVYLHWDGVGKRVGGQNIHNHMVGPPVILPLIVVTVATIDLVRLLQGGF